MTNSDVLSEIGPQARRLSENAFKQREQAGVLVDWLRGYDKWVGQGTDVVGQLPDETRGGVMRWLKTQGPSGYVKTLFDGGNGAWLGLPEQAGPLGIVAQMGFVREELVIDPKGKSDLKKGVGLMVNLTHISGNGGCVVVDEERALLFMGDVKPTILGQESLTGYLDKEIACRAGMVKDAFRDKPFEGML